MRLGHSAEGISWFVAALSTVSLSRGFAPLAAVPRGGLSGLGGLPTVRDACCDGHWAGSSSALRLRCRPRAAAWRGGALQLRSADMSLAVSETPPEEDPLADIPEVQLQTPDGPLLTMPAEWDRSGVYCCFNKEGAMQYVAMSRKVAVSIENHLQLLSPDDLHTCKAVTWDKPSKQDLEGTATAWIQYCIDLTGGAPPGNTREVEIWRAKAADVRRAKPNIQFAEDLAAKNDTALAVAEIKRLVAAHTVVLFIKGTRQAPQCGFTDATVALFDQLGVDYECIDCLDEERNPGLREAIKELSVWPTIPQVYIGGEFTGGADVCRELAESGELQEVIRAALAAKRRTMEV